MVEPVDPLQREESGSGKLVEGILASIAEFYSANLGQEVRKGMDRKASEGIWPTQVAIGYRNVRVSRNARRGEAIIVPDEDRASLVQHAFELYATGDWPLRGYSTTRTRSRGSSSCSSL